MNLADYILEAEDLNPERIKSEVTRTLVGKDFERTLPEYLRQTEAPGRHELEFMVHQERKEQERLGIDSRPAWFMQVDVLAPSDRGLLVHRDKIAERISDFLVREGFTPWLADKAAQWHYLKSSDKLVLSLPFYYERAL